jgi:hypothetical protein
MSPWWDDERLLDTLPLSPGAYLAVLARLEMGDGDRQRCPAPRAGIRHLPTLARVRLRFADGARAAYAVKAHDLTRTGVAFLHGFPMGPGTDCEVALWKLDQAVAVLPGCVIRCRDLGERIHEIGVDFAAAINPGEFVPTRSAADAVLLAVHGTGRARR